MVDPVTLTTGAFVAGAATNAAGNLLSDAARKAAPVLWRSVSSAVQEAMQRALPQARRQLETNAAEFVTVLATEVTRGADASTAPEVAAAAVASRMEDPDVAIAITDALRAAGRTSSAERHQALAKVVSARLAAPTDSGQAVTANLATRTIEVLDGTHLRVLALLALIHYAGRPNSVADPFVPLEAGPGYPGFQEDPASGRAQQYAAWAKNGESAAHAYAVALLAKLRERVARFVVPSEVPDAVMLHIEAAGCVLQHELTPHLSTLLPDPLGRPADDEAGGRDLGYGMYANACQGVMAVPILRHPPLDQLSALWQATLHRYALTPVGLLIGLAAYDVTTGEHRVREWEWAKRVEDALRLPTDRRMPPFTEWARETTFQDALGDALVDMAERGDVKLRRVLKR